MLSDDGAVSQTINDGEEPSEEQAITEKAITNKVNNFIKYII